MGAMHVDWASKVHFIKNIITKVYGSYARRLGNKVLEIFREIYL